MIGFNMKKQQVMYIHGGSAYDLYDDFLADLGDMKVWGLPDEKRVTKWTKDFQADLGDEYEVFMPSMPNKQNAQYKEWKIWFERYFAHIHDGAILIGCSLGGYFLVKYLSENELPFQCKGAIIMAAPFENFHNPELSRESGGDFAAQPNSLQNIIKRVDSVTFMHSTDDFVVPYEHALQYKKALPEAELVTFEDKTHFLVEELPELVTLIQKISE